MLRSLFTLRGFAIAVLVVAVLSYIITNPNHAASVAADGIHTVLGWGEQFVSAVITFVQKVTG
jgi:cell shape-determining protein MreC